MGIFFWVVFPGIVLLVLECLIVALPNIKAARFVIPGLAGAVFFFTVCVTVTVTGWDSLGWGVLSMIAGSGLIGSLLGLGTGCLLRRLKKRYAHEETDKTI